MNGYFNNLALRSVNAGNLVEPRLPSLFEPQRSEPDAATAVYSEPRPVSIDAPPTESPQLRVPIEEPSAAVEDVAEPRPVSPTRTLAETSAPVERSEHRVHADPITLPEHAAVAEPAIVSTEAHGADQTTSQPAPVEPRMAPKITPKPATKSVQTVVHQPDKTVPSVAVTKIKTPETLPVRQSTIKAETTSQVEEHVSVVEEQQVFLEPAPILKTPTLFQTKVDAEVVERVIERSRNTDKTDFRSVTRAITNYAWREPDPSQPEPSINITIGRVEVRAAPASNTKPTRTRQESPVMPLDEYLRKQRRGGER